MQSVLPIPKLQNKIDSNDQNERGDTLIISGPETPTVTSDEKSKELLQALLCRHLNFNISLSDISVAHRLTPTSRINKTIICNLCRRDLVSEIFQSCKHFKDMKGQQPFYVNSSLTPIRNKLFYILRQLKKKSVHQKSSLANHNLAT